MFDAYNSYNEGLLLMGAFIALSGLMLYPIPCIRQALEKVRFIVTHLSRWLNLFLATVERFLKMRHGAKYNKERCKDQYRGISRSRGEGADNLRISFLRCL